MTINRDEILKVARLARLSIDAEAVDQVARQIDDILTYIDILRQVDTSEVAPTSHATARRSAFREDRPLGSVPREQALANAPDQDGTYFLVPRVIQ